MTPGAVPTRGQSFSVRKNACDYAEEINDIINTGHTSAALSGQTAITPDNVWRNICMIDQKKAEEILRGKLAKNLMIMGADEDEECWIFYLGLRKDNGELLPLVGESFIKVRKTDGAIE